MGILSNSNTFTRFRLPDGVPQSLWPTVNDKLKKFAFQDIDNMIDERSFGWVNLDDMLDSSWRMSPPEKGEYLAFSLRLDTRRVPAGVFNKHFLLAMEKEKERIKEQGEKQFIARSRRIELREIVRARLSAKTLPTPAVFDVVWATDSNMIYLASTQKSVIELFVEYFAKTFELELEQLTPYNLALPQQNRAALPDNETGEIRLDSLAGHVDTELGQDFLTWLWFRSEVPLDFVDSRKQHFSVNMGSRIVVQGGAGDTLETAIVSGECSELCEARLGLKRGKKVIQACILPEQDSRSWQYNLKAEDFSFSGLKAPKIYASEDDDPDALFLEKMYLLERAFDMTDAAYSLFLKQRIDPELWQSETKAMDEWIGESH